MSGEERLVTDPWIFAVGSGIAVALATMLLDGLRQRMKHGKRRKAYLKTVKNQLENNRKTLDELSNDLQGSKILPDFDLSIIHNFLASDYVDIENDEIFLNKLQRHLENIGKYKIAVQQILLYRADFTSQGFDKAEGLKGSLVKVVSLYQKDLQSCISEIEKLIGKKLNDHT